MTDVARVEFRVAPKDGAIGGRHAAANDDEAAPTTHEDTAEEPLTHDERVALVGQLISEQAKSPVGSVAIPLLTLLLQVLIFILTATTGGAHLLTVARTFTVDLADFVLGYGTLRNVGDSPLLVGNSVKLTDGQSPARFDCEVIAVRGRDDDVRVHWEHTAD